MLWHSSCVNDAVTFLLVFAVCLRGLGGYWRGVRVIGDDGKGFAAGQKTSIRIRGSIADDTLVHPMSRVTSHPSFQQLELHHTKFLIMVRALVCHDVSTRPTGPGSI